MWTCSRFPRLIFMCAYVCVNVWDVNRGSGVESEWAELFNLRLGWEISQGAMCHGEQAEWGDLWEPNLKHCHDGSWKRVKVGGSVIFKDEPRGKADRKQGQIWPRRKNRRRMQSYFHSDVSFPLLFFKRSHWGNCWAQSPFSNCSTIRYVGENISEIKTRAEVYLCLPPSKKLHPQQSKDHNEEEEEEEQADDGLHGTHKGHH